MLPVKRETTQTLPSSAACGRQLPPKEKPLELTGAFSPWGRRCPRPRPRTDEGRACGGCPLKGGHANSALISRLRAAASVYALRAAFGGCAPTRACGRSPSGEAFRTGAAPRGKPLELTGAFSPWGRRCPRPRPWTDEGRVCGGCLLKGDHANSALISRLRAAASPEGEAFRTGAAPWGKPLEMTGAFSPWGRRCPRPRPRTDEGRACGCCPLKEGYANSALISRLRAAASPEGEAFKE